MIGDIGKHNKMGKKLKVSGYCVHIKKDWDISDYLSL